MDRTTSVPGVPGEPEREGPPEFVWEVERGAYQNYYLLGMALTEACAQLYRRPGEPGLIHLQPEGKVRMVIQAKDLAPILADHLQMVVVKEGKPVRELPTADHLGALLRSERFLQNFLPVDRVTTTAIYSAHFTLVEPGYNDLGPGNRLVYIGGHPAVAGGTETIGRFLEVMDFASAADRTNAVAAALTALLHNHWPGQKPLVLITANKSHAGKSTLAEFVRGTTPQASILYENIDWPMQSQLQRQLHARSDTGVILLDNIRQDSAGRGKFIRSGFIEALVTSEEIHLASPGAGGNLALANHYVVVANTNDGHISPDLMNRALPIHLDLTGDVRARASAIGNPKYEFLPANQEQIAAELRGMIERWKQAGRPLDTAAQHPMSVWARTVGGILQVSGYHDFLANLAERQNAQDVLREALAILGCSAPGKALRPRDWAELAARYGVAKILIPNYHRDPIEARAREMGKVMATHLGEVMEGESETTRYQLALKGGRQRWDSKAPHKRYLFDVVAEQTLAVENAENN
jgi:hypothetical protein